MNDQKWLNTALASMHSGQWFGWKKEDEDGNKIADDDRVSYENLIVRNTSNQLRQK